MTPTNGEMNRKSEKVRRANRTIQNRTLILMAFLGVGVFIALFFKLFSCKFCATTSWRPRPWTSRPAAPWSPPPGAPFTTATAILWPSPPQRKRFFSPLWK
ncbi:MAG: hypothetical protein ACLUNQ_09445 [Oscillospiraceae bacterium]